MLFYKGNEINFEILKMKPDFVHFIIVLSHSPDLVQSYSDFEEFISHRHSFNVICVFSVHSSPAHIAHCICLHTVNLFGLFFLKSVVFVHKYS